MSSSCSSLGTGPSHGVWSTLESIRKAWIEYKVSALWKEGSQNSLVSQLFCIRAQASFISARH